MKILFLINPAAGKGGSIKIWREIKRKIDDAGLEYGYKFTAAPKDATHIAKAAAAEKIDILAVLGGDGTLQEAVNGLVGSETSLAILPAGTGNDFAKTLKIPKDVGMMTKILLKPEKKRIDLLKCNEKYLINMAGTGFDAEVAANVNKKKCLKGELAYLSAILQTLAVYRPYDIEIIIDGVKTRENITLIAVGNGQYIGGGIHMLPNAQIDDGLLDICVIKKTTKFEALLTLPQVYAGRHITHPKCRFFKGREVIINVMQNEPKVFSQVDGQVFSEKSLHISVVPEAISILV